MPTTIYSSQVDARSRAIAAVQAGNKPVAWILRGTAGVVWNPQSNSAPTIVPDVQAALQNIGGDYVLVQGNAGLSVLLSPPVLVSTINNQSADDYASQQLLPANVTFIKAPVYLN